MDTGQTQEMAERGRTVAAQMHPNGFGTIAAVRRANKAAGYHFFDRSTMRGFRSIVGRTVYGGRYFITSEQFVGSDHTAAPRKYTVREAKPGGDINTVGQFQAYRSAVAARDAIYRLLHPAEQVTAEGE